LQREIWIGRGLTGPLQPTTTTTTSLGGLNDEHECETKYRII
jgi:hypothetical protein